MDADVFEGGVDELAQELSRLHDKPVDYWAASHILRGLSLIGLASKVGYSEGLKGKKRVKWRVETWRLAPRKRK